MKQLLVILACFFCVSVSAANDYIRVTGEAATIEQAKENAFREAVQIRAGTIVLSERESNLTSLVKDNISVYSAGYVDDFKIVSVGQQGSYIKITMDVLVADSKLMNQMLSSGKTQKDIDGQRAGASYSTFMDQKAKGDQILSKVLATYPKNAFTINQEPYRISVDSYRNAILEVPYKLKWNYDYIVAFNEAMGLLEDNRFNMLQQAPGNIYVMAKNPKDFILGEKKHFKFVDLLLVERVKNSVKGDNEVRIQMIITDRDNNLLYKTCYIPTGSFYSIGEPNRFMLYGNTTEQNVLRAVIPQDRDYVIKRASRIEVSVVPDNKCEK